MGPGGRGGGRGKRGQEAEKRGQGRRNGIMYNYLATIITENPFSLHFYVTCQDIVFDVYVPCFGDISLSISPPLSLSGVLLS